MFKWDGNLRRVLVHRGLVEKTGLQLIILLFKGLKS